MNKNTVFIISIIVNIILSVVFLVEAAGAADELKFNYVEEDTLTPDTIRSNIERENYGVAAARSQPIRGGAEVADEYMDYYMLGEYADLLFIKEVFAAAGNSQTAKTCEERIEEIRSSMPVYGTLFEKMDWSAQNARR